MSTKNDAAFPLDFNTEYSAPGLTKLEWFAGMALQGLLAAGVPPNTPGFAFSVFNIAEAILAESEIRRDK